MTEFPLQLVRRKEPAETSRPKHPLGEMNADRVAKHLVLFRPDPKGLDSLVAKARSSIPGLTHTGIVHGVVARNPDCVWAIARKGRCDSSPPVGEGFIAMLPLTITGLKLLAANKLDTRDP